MSLIYRGNKDKGVIYEMANNAYILFSILGEYVIYVQEQMKRI